MRLSGRSFVLSLILLAAVGLGQASAQLIVPDEGPAATRAAPAKDATAQPSAPPPRAFEYSDGYRLRAKIHKISSLATIPLFATEAVIGQSLYSETTSAKKDAHLAVAAGIGALFVVNTTTGLWNLVEARKDPNHRRRRLLHGLLMLGADAGFLATAALGPESEHGVRDESAGAHRAVAFTSIGMASAGYLIMLFGGH